MNRERVILLIIVLLGALGAGAWAVSSTRVPQTASSGTAATQSSQQFTPAVTIDLPLVVRHKVQGNTHTYHGTVALQHTCDSLSSSLSALGTSPAHLQITISVNNGSCTDTTLTQTEFSVSFKGTDTKPPVLDAILFNGMEIPYTLTEEK